MDKILKTGVVFYTKPVSYRWGLTNRFIVTFIQGMIRAYGETSNIKSSIMIEYWRVLKR